MPPEPLGTMISLHVLRGGTLKDLVEALHPDPENADTEQLEGIVNRLRRESRRLATGVRGGNVRTGRKAAPLSELEHALAVSLSPQSRSRVSCPWGTFRPGRGLVPAPLSRRSRNQL
jgi:hypothetical protein